MSELRELSVGDDGGGARADVFLAAALDISRSAASRLLRDGLVRCCGKPLKPGQSLAPGMRLCVALPAPAPLAAPARDIPLEIVYQDADIAVINKPQGMVVHPAPGHLEDTLVNAALHHIQDLSGVGGALRPGIVHRIDKMTSGLLVVAKHDAAHQSLARQLKDHAMQRTYLALVEGNLKEDAGTVDAAIARHRRDRKRMAVDPEGRSAVTHWRVLARFGAYTLLEVRLETGRTHQIRVHMASIRHPVAGDVVYGPKSNRLNLLGQALHALRLQLVHPGTGREMSFYAPPPSSFLAALNKAGWGGEPLWQTPEELGQ